MREYGNIIALGDIHFPYHHRKALKESLYILKQAKPTVVVQMGDLYDQYCWSRFTKRNLTTPERELHQAQASGIALWHLIREIVPSARKFQLLGNHDIRGIKRCQEKFPEGQSMFRKSVLELYQFKGVETIEDDRRILEISGVSFHHGYLGSLGSHMRYFGTNFVVGHSHSGGVVYESRNGKAIGELNAGYLADPTAEPLRYKTADSTKFNKWTHGVGLITFRGKQPQLQFISI